MSRWTSIVDTLKLQQPCAAQSTYVMLNAMFEAMDDDDRDETSLELIQEPGLMDALNFYIKVQKQGKIYQTSASLILFSLSGHCAVKL